MTIEVLIFDVEGTLFDTRAAHVEAWEQALAASGFLIPPDRLESEIDKGGEQLVSAVLGQHAESHSGESLRRTESALFARIVKERGLRLFPAARELLAAVHERRILVVLATSDTQEQLQILQTAAGVDLQKTADLIVTREDTAGVHPAPDAVTAALRKLDRSPALCALVGDKIADMKAGTRAGVICLGVLTGHESAEQLLRSGARAVYADTAELLARLDEMLQLASPCAIRLGTEVLEGLMREALAEASRGLENGQAPIGCILASGSGEVLSRGYNQMMSSGDLSAHAEIVAIRNAAGKLLPGQRDYILVSTLEPCVMCTGAAMELGVDTILYGLPAPADGGTERVSPPRLPYTQMPRIIGGILSAQSRHLFERFAGMTSNPVAQAFTKQLLAGTSLDGKS